MSTNFLGGNVVVGLEGFLHAGFLHAREGFLHAGLGGDFRPFSGYKMRVLKPTDALAQNDHNVPPKNFQSNIPCSFPSAQSSFSFGKKS